MAISYNSSTLKSEKGRKESGRVKACYLAVGGKRKEKRSGAILSFSRWPPSERREERKILDLLFSFSYALGSCN